MCEKMLENTGLEDQQDLSGRQFSQKTLFCQLQAFCFPQGKVCTYIVTNKMRAGE